MLEERGSPAISQHDVINDKCFHLGVEKRCARNSELAVVMNMNEMLSYST